MFLFYEVIWVFFLFFFFFLSPACLLLVFIGILDWIDDGRVITLLVTAWEIPGLL